MAAIDKTYVNSYKDYMDMVNWAKDKSFTCPNGITLHPSDYIYEDLTEDYFIKDGEPRYMPIMNTSCSIDYFLIKYCPFDWFRKSMEIAYGEKYINDIINGTSHYDLFSKTNVSTKFKMIRHSDDGNYNTPMRARNRYGHKYLPLLWIEVKLNGRYLRYNKKHDIFLWDGELGDGSSSVCHACKSIRALKRKIRKWKLPKGTIVEAKGRYIGEDWEFICK